MRHQVLAILIIAALMPLNDALKCHQCFEVFDDEGKRLATVKDIEERFAPLLKTIPGLEDTTTDVGSAFITKIVEALTALGVKDDEKETAGKLPGTGGAEPSITTSTAPPATGPPTDKKKSGHQKRGLGAFWTKYLLNGTLTMCPDKLEEGGSGGASEGANATKEASATRSDSASGPDGCPAEATQCFKSKTRIAGLDFIQRSCSTPTKLADCQKSEEKYKTAFPSGINYMECAECSSEDGCNSATSLTTGFFVMFAALATIWF